MERQGTCIQRLDKAFISLDPRDLEGLGEALREDPNARRRYERLVEVDLALAQELDPFVVLGPLEERVASSYASISAVFNPHEVPEIEEVKAKPPRRIRAARWLIAAAAVVLAVLVPSIMNQDPLDIDQAGSWAPRGAPGVYLHPYCMDPESGDLEDASIRAGIAACALDSFLVLTYALHDDEGGWLHTLAQPLNEEAPVWITPNPVDTEATWIEPTDRRSSAWPPIDLSINYAPGAYRLHWAVCDAPIPWTDWSVAAETGSEEFYDLMDLQPDCEWGSWVFVLQEVTP